MDVEKRAYAYVVPDRCRPEHTENEELTIRAVAKAKGLDLARTFVESAREQGAAARQLRRVLAEMDGPEVPKPVLFVTRVSECPWPLDEACRLADVVPVYPPVNFDGLSADGRELWDAIRAYGVDVPMLVAVRDGLSAAGRS